MKNKKKNYFVFLMKLSLIPFILLSCNTFKYFSKISKINLSNVLSIIYVCKLLHLRK